MRTRHSFFLALASSVLAHAVLLLAGQAPPVPGKNVQAISYPVRVRLSGVRPGPPAPAAPPAGAAGEMPAAAALPAATPEGRIDVEPTRFAETSDHYFTRDELDGRPVVLDPPDLGAAELSPLLEGRAVLLFYLNEHGDVDRIEIEQNTLPPAMMAQLELQREHIKFTPGNKNGVAVKSVVRFEIALAKVAAKQPAVLP